MPRRVITVRGMVQGVGFRPFVHATACRLGLTGFVRNQGGVVWIEVQGADAALDCFLCELTDRPPSAASIDKLHWLPAAERGEAQFSIEGSDCGESGAVSIVPDIATCEECLAELFDPADRRYRYPFLNCAHCGPRL